MGRHFLQIPGPTNVPDRVLRAIDAPTIDHRGPAFAELGREVLDGMAEVFRTDGPVVIYPSSGTGAWEAALVNTLSPGDRVLAFETGHFATLWRTMAERLGLEVDWIEGDWRHGVDPDRVAAVLRSDPSIAAVMVVHNETSTGVTSRVSEVREAIDAAGSDALFLVDTISSLGSIDYRHDEWGVDVTVGCSQKGLMLPPGLGFNAVSSKALAASEQARLPRSYCDWEPILEANRAGFWPYTSATNLLYGLREAIAMLREEGLENVFARHQRHAAATRAAVRAWGLEVLCLDEREHSAALTAVVVGERRRDPARDPRALRHVARRRAGQGRRARVPDRPPRRLQRPDAGGHAVRGRDGAAAGRRAGGRQRRGGRPRAAGARARRGVTGEFAKRIPLRVRLANIAGRSKVSASSSSRR